MIVSSVAKCVSRPFSTYRNTAFTGRSLANFLHTYTSSAEKSSLSPELRGEMLLPLPKDFKRPLEGRLEYISSELRDSKLPSVRRFRFQGSQAALCYMLGDFQQATDALLPEASLENATARILSFRATLLGCHAELVYKDTPALLVNSLKDEALRKIDDTSRLLHYDAVTRCVTNLRLFYWGLGVVRYDLQVNKISCASAVKQLKGYEREYLQEEPCSFLFHKPA